VIGGFGVLRYQQLDRYVLFVQDYGGAVGFRLALAHPDRVTALVIQNAVAHEEGLGPLWETRKAYWRGGSANEAGLRENPLSLEARYAPGAWSDEYAFLSRPGQAAIQSELFYDYRTNLTAYPRWQEYLCARSQF
jgi:pimeloyl-ACP methyl ester carboxylesterase